MVPSRSAISPAEMSRWSCRPSNTTASPSWTPGTSVTSTIVRSMQTRPITGARQPRTSTSARSPRARAYPSPYPTGSVAMRLDRRAVQRSPYDTFAPGGTRLRKATADSSVSTGFSGQAPSRPESGDAPYSVTPGRTMTVDPETRGTRPIITAAEFAAWTHRGRCPRSDGGSFGRKLEG